MTSLFPRKPESRRKGLNLFLKIPAYAGMTDFMEACSRTLFRPSKAKTYSCHDGTFSVRFHRLLSFILTLFTVEIPRPSRVCSVSSRDFQPNETLFSVLTGEPGLFVRHDISAEHWTGPPKEFFGWWKSTAKHVAGHGSQQVSGETLHDLFERLTAQPDEEDTLYILTLLLLRRKLLRYERETVDEQGNRLLEVYALHSNMTYQVPIAMPSHERLEEIQQQLVTLTNA